MFDWKAWALSLMRRVVVKPKPRPVVPVIDWDDEYKRLNYYKAADFAEYQAALRARVPDASGTLPWIDPANFATPCPTPAEWLAIKAAKRP